MQIVPRALVRPNHCAVFPQLGQAHEKGYFETGVELAGVDPHIYVSVEAVEQMARQLGWSEPLALTELEITVEAKDKEIAHLEDKVKGLQEFKDSIHSIQQVSDLQAFRQKKADRPEVVA